MGKKRVPRGLKQKRRKTNPEESGERANRVGLLSDLLEKRDAEQRKKQTPFFRSSGDKFSRGEVRCRGKKR